jgi:hypothetical protein
MDLIKLVEGPSATGNYVSADGLAGGTVVTLTGTQTVTNKTATSLILNGTPEVSDDVLFTLGNDNDEVLVHRTATLSANTALTGAIVGTPKTTALAANSLIVSNITASGDIMVAGNRGGNSEEYLHCDASTGQLKLTSPAEHMLLFAGTTATDTLGKTVRINSITNTGTANSLIGFQSKPAQGASTAQNVIGCEISPRVNDTFALTSTGTLIGAHIDAYLKGTTGNVGGDVRGAQIELVTDDAGTRTISGDVIGLRMRAAFSGTITGNMTAIKIEKAEAQTNSKQWEYVLELTGDNTTIWSDGYGTEAADENGGFKVRINGQDRWVKTYGTAPIV